MMLSPCGDDVRMFRETYCIYRQYHVTTTFFFPYLLGHVPPKSRQHGANVRRFDHTKAQRL